MEQKILRDLEKSYGIHPTEITEVFGGWLNKKWKVTDNNQTFLVKQYSHERFNKAKLEQIDLALRRQIILENSGIPCPNILEYNGSPIRMPDSETTYMVMDFCEGKIESNSTITLAQMNSLGSVCGAMHKEFSKLPTKGVKGFPICTHKFLDSLWSNYYSLSEKMPEDTPNEYKLALSAQEPILKSLKADFFDKLPKGIGHEDFSPDNMLFNKDSVSAIIDFDRNEYSFIWHDIGRVVLSFALDNNRIDISKVKSFIDGYSQHMPLTINNIVDALRITWCIEAKWWIRPEFFISDRDKTVRFRDEILWLTDNWSELESFILI